MVDKGMVVYVLLVVGDSHTTKVNVGSTASKSHTRSISCSATHESDAIDMYITIRFLAHIEIA